MTDDNTTDAIRRAANTLEVAGERLIGPSLSEREVGLALLAAAIVRLARLMPPRELREHLARLAEDLEVPAAAE